jgi:SAM-dependent methyltransferase
MHPENPEDYIRINMKHWNIWAKQYWTKQTDRLKQIRDGAPYLEKAEPKLAPYLRDVEGKKIIVLQFGDGLAMLACAKKGAIVTGVDFSATQIRLARKAAAYCRVNVNLVKADSQNLPKSIPSNSFDLAVAECGIFCWIQKPEAWMKNAYRVLKKQGRLAISDFHILSAISEEKKGKISFRRSYFDQNPEISKPKENAPPVVNFYWRLSDIVNAAIHAGFRIDHLEEFYYEKENGKPPLLPTDFLLAATKD